MCVATRFVAVCASYPRVVLQSSHCRAPRWSTSPGAVPILEISTWDRNKSTGNRNKGTSNRNGGTGNQNRGARAGRQPGVDRRLGGRAHQLPAAHAPHGRVEPEPRRAVPHGGRGNPSQSEPSRCRTGRSASERASAICRTLMRSDRRPSSSGRLNLQMTEQLQATLASSVFESATEKYRAAPHRAGTCHR